MFIAKFNSAIKYLLISLATLSVHQVHAGWQLEWIDDFDGNGVNWSNWTAQTQANYNNEVQCYTDDDSSSERNYDVSEGTLKIIARKKTLSCSTLGGQTKTWTSGRLNSKDKQEFLYGRIESRLRFLNLEGGTWPAFWMLENRIAEQPIAGDNDFVNWPNPGAGEIDVWEWFGNGPNSYITNFFNTSGCGSEVRYTYPNGPVDVTQWHTYAIEWNEDDISFYVDDTLVVSHNVSSCTQYKEPMFVLLNVAMGGNLGGAIDPNLTQAVLEIDYVAHCSTTSANDRFYCNDSVSTTNDDDGDGVNNNDDLCPDTPPGQSVDVNGCSVSQELNEAPEFSFIVTQQGVEGTIVEDEGGPVTITVEIFDENASDTHQVTWDVNQLVNPTVNGSSVAFNPTNMEIGNYTITATVTDNGTPNLSVTNSVTIRVATPPPPQLGTGGGGGLSYWVLLLISITLLLMRNRLTKTR
ncbi:family 16 glycosylhydrolase [Aliikangiella marina]|uniref:Family 16 glycosylhydrolase n=1 Tax=Aliikangiella marina TaxID=1712262 RepID=A0A545T1M3_9GAMM|nr:glycoside hydrolase family 16 protein [Aliikangiella marina]TQV71114.1 family 16 glycosylhydrolase [Aliikangiella marina]